MAETTYSYTISTDFPGGAVNPSKLDAEIRAESGITISLKGINTSGDNLDIIFNDALPAGSKTVLDGDQQTPALGLIQNHDNTPSVNLQRVIEEDQVGGAPARLAGHYVSAAQNETKTNNVILTEDLYLQGVDVFFSNMYAGDYSRMDVLHPGGDDNPQSALTTSDNVVTLASTGKGVYYDPVTVSPYLDMEFYDDTGKYRFYVKVSSVSGDVVTLASNVPEAVGTDWTVKARVQSFCMAGSNFYMVGSNRFKYFQHKAFTGKMLAGLIFSVKLTTNNTDAGTRALCCNYICRKPIS